MRFKPNGYNDPSPTMELYERWNELDWDSLFGTSVHQNNTKTSLGSDSRKQ